MDVSSMTKKKLLIIDEHGFSRVCSALLESIGYGAVISDSSNMKFELATRDIGLIVTSYPYGLPFFADIKSRNVPTVILSNNVDDDLINALNDIDNSYCMIKPLDYSRFKSLVGQLMSGEIALNGGYSIV